MSPRKKTETQNDEAKEKSPGHLVEKPTDRTMNGPIPFMAMNHSARKFYFDDDEGGDEPPKKPGRAARSLAWLLLLLAVSQLLSLPAFCDTPRVRLKDVARIKGVRPNQLMGRGLVVGLDGSGDKLLLSAQMITNLLSQYGTSFPKEDLKTKNVAAVIITATLPPFASSGDQIDVTVASMADAKSLKGGVLLRTPLFAPDGSAYAVAQGNVLTVPSGVGTSGFIPGGAIVEKEVNVPMVDGGRLRIVLDKKDFTTANRVRMAINDKFGEGRARAEDSGTIAVDLPISFRDNVVGFISSLEDLMIVPDAPARVVINERTGTVVIGQNVRISTAALSHGDLTVTVGKGGTARVMPVDSAATVDQLVKAMNAIGASPKDLVAIMQTLKKAGALHADLNIM